MSEAALIQRVSDDLTFLKERIIKIEEDVEEISSDLHRKVKPEYFQKLNKIDAGRFLTEAEFEREMRNES